MIYVCQKCLKARKTSREHPPAICPTCQRKIDSGQSRIVLSRRDGSPIEMPEGVTYYSSIPSGAEPEEFYWRPKAFPMGGLIPGNPGKKRKASYSRNGINSPKLPITPKARVILPLKPRRKPGLLLRVLMEIDAAGPMILVGVWILTAVWIALRDWNLKIL